MTPLFVAPASERGGTPTPKESEIAVEDTENVTIVAEESEGGREREGEAEGKEEAGEEVTEGDGGEEVEGRDGPGEDEKGEGEGEGDREDEGGEGDTGEGKEGGGREEGSEEGLSGEEENVEVYTKSQITSIQNVPPADESAGIVTTNGATATAVVTTGDTEATLEKKAELATHEVHIQFSRNV